MKNILLFLLVLTVSNTAISRRAETNEFLIYSMIAKRCERYLPENKIHECQESVALMLELLDYHLMISPDSSTAAIPDSFVFVAFKKNLIDLLSDPATTDYLEKLNRELNKYLLDTNEHFNLWDLTLAHYHSRLKSSQVLSCLFQDISSAKLHLIYLEKANINGGKNFKINKELLHKTIETINLVVDYSPENFQNLFYPTSLNGSSNRNIYHFYVPFSLSLELQSKNMTPNMAFVAPLMLTLTYEFVTTSKDYRYVYSDPERLDSTEHSWKLKDIYSGYSGVNMAAGKKPELKIEELSELFHSSTQVAVKKILE